MHRNTLRQRGSRLVREALSFSKKLINYIGAIPQRFADDVFELGLPLCYCVAIWMRGEPSTQYDNGLLPGRGPWGDPGASL